jgi:hypothetical protein
LAILEKASNLGYLFPYGPSEPPSRDQVMKCPKDAMPEVKFFDVSNTNALGHVFDLKPCVKASWDTVLKGHVYMIRPIPSVTGDHRTFEATEEPSILASQHAVGNVGELGYPHHLRVSLGVLGRVQNEIKCLDSTDSPCDCDSFTSDHRCLQLSCQARLEKGIFSLPSSLLNTVRPGNRSGRITCLPPFAGNESLTRLDSPRDVL